LLSTEFLAFLRRLDIAERGEEEEGEGEEGEEGRTMTLQFVLDIRCVLHKITMNKVQVYRYTNI
jgi:hypothetical protein